MLRFVLESASYPDSTTSILVYRRSHSLIEDWLTYLTYVGRRCIAHVQVRQLRWWTEPSEWWCIETGSMQESVHHVWFSYLQKIKKWRNDAVLTIGTITAELLAKCFRKRQRIEPSIIPINLSNRHSIACYIWCLFTGWTRRSCQELDSKIVIYKNIH